MTVLVTVQVGVGLVGQRPSRNRRVGPVCAALPRTPAQKQGVRGPLAPVHPAFGPARLNGYLCYVLSLFRICDTDI
jgi:hypothetical protein